MSKKSDDTSFIEAIKCELPKLHQVFGGLDSDTGYPADYQGFTTKSEPLLTELLKLTGRNVLDIGCNSGLYSYVAGKNASRVTGCDLEKILLKRASLSRSFFDRFYRTTNVEFYEGSFVDKLSVSIDAVIAACVLYHIGDSDLMKLQRFLKKCKPLVILQTRPQRYDAFLRNPGWSVPSYTNLHNGMYTVADNIEFLKTCGYDKITIIGLNSTLFFGETFPIVLASA